jgi:3,4-dihydroxy-2-butanone 4-phosphate synthase
LDLARLAGCKPVAVLAEVVNDDGTVKRLDGLKELAIANSIVLTSVQDLIAYRVEMLSHRH